MVIKDVPLNKCNRWMWNQKQKQKESVFNKKQGLTHFHVPGLCVSGGFTPRRQGVDGHKVGVELTVGVGEDAPQFGDQLSGTVLPQRFRWVFSPSSLIEQTFTL